MGSEVESGMFAVTVQPSSAKAAPAQTRVVPKALLEHQEE